MTFHDDLLCRVTTVVLSLERLLLAGAHCNSCSLVLLVLFKLLVDPRHQLYYWHLTNTRLPTSTTMSPEGENASLVSTQHEPSRDSGVGPTSPPDMLPGVVTRRAFVQASSPLHATKTQYLSCGSPRISSLFPIRQDTSTSLIYTSPKVVSRSRNHALDEKLGLHDQTSLHTPMHRRSQILGCLSITALVVFLFVSDPSQSLFDTSLSAMTRSFGLLHACISVILVTVNPSQSVVPSSFPPSGKVLWYRTPGIAWSKDYLPIGNGFLAGNLSFH